MGGEKRISGLGRGHKGSRSGGRGRIRDRRRGGYGIAAGNTVISWRPKDQGDATGEDPMDFKVNQGTGPPEIVVKKA